jgi:nitrite reductase/ring-hydroxylating ferredoxin subunit
MTEYLVGKRSDIPDGKCVAVEAGRRTVAVYRVGDNFHAVANACPHKGASLCEGEVLAAGAMVRCPWHHWNWRLDTGELEADPRQKLRVYDVVVDGDDVVLRV